MGHADVVYGRTGNAPSCLPWLAAGLALLAACSPLTVAPIVEDSETVDVPGIAGRWVDKDGDTTTITAVGDGEYTLSFSERSERATRFQARLGRLGDRLVMDVWAQLEKNEAAGLTETLLGTVVPGHLLVVMELQGDRLRAAMLKEDSLRSALRTGVLRTASMELDGTLVLTAPHDSLRAALAGYLERPGVLGEWEEARRAAGTEDGTHSMARPARLYGVTIDEYDELRPTLARQVAEYGAPIRGVRPSRSAPASREDVRPGPRQ